MDVVGTSRPWWQVQQVTIWAPPKLVLLIVATISVILRAVIFLGVSMTQFTVSEPAPGWQSEQSKPTPAAMTPMACRKSSTLSTFRVLVLTALKYCPAGVLEFATPL